MTEPQAVGAVVTQATGVDFNGLDRETFQNLPAGHPIYFRGPDGSMSVEHTVLGNGKFSRSQFLEFSAALDWGYVPDSSEVGSELQNPKSKSVYTITSVGQKGITSYFVGEMADEKLPLFSTDPRS